MKQPRILIVEDEPLIAMMLEDILDMAGYAVLGPVTTVKTALEVIDRNPPDAAIVDLMLNGDDSYGVMAKLRECDIPFAVSSGLGADIDPNRAGEGTPILGKPYIPEDLETVLADLLS